MAQVAPTSRIRWLHARPRVLSWPPPCPRRAPPQLSTPASRCRAARWAWGAWGARDACLSVHGVINVACGYPTHALIVWTCCRQHAGENAHRLIVRAVTTTNMSTSCADMAAHPTMSLHSLAVSMAAPTGVEFTAASCSGGSDAPTAAVALLELTATLATYSVFTLRYQRRS